MTFGEHLEELRRRIIFCLIYLAVAGSLTLTYGTELLRWTLAPHYTAIRATQRTRLIHDMAEKLESLGRFTSTQAIAVGENPRLTRRYQSADWALLFVADVATPQIVSRLEQPFVALAGRLGAVLPSLPVPEREAFSDEVRGLGSRLAGVIGQELSPSLGAPGVSNIPQRFDKLAVTFEEIQKRSSSVEEYIGWSESFNTIFESLKKFLQFLETKKDELGKLPVSLAELHEQARISELPYELVQVLEALERDAEDIREEKAIELVAISYMEPFMAYFKVAILFGLLIAMPFILYELWKFVGSGLYPHEQRYVVTLLPFSFLLFFGGAAFGYTTMIPLGLRFLSGWGLQEVRIGFTLQNYIGLFMMLTLILGLVFQTPLIMIFLSKIGIVKVGMFRRARRIAIFAGVCLAVVLTPPDPVSWSLMALPMILLYEIGILACAVMEKKDVG
jgi:sec-independent protein translocase protein TatC